MKLISTILRAPSKSHILRCGLLSVINQDSSKPLLDVTKFREGLAKLDHRGPDDSGVYIGDNGRVMMGHTRLSIIDLVGGHQPLASEDGMVQVVVNGELYDFERIRNELQKDHGSKFKTSSDSEIALHLYLNYGISFINRLRGEFAILIWDKRYETFFAIRDRVSKLR